MRVGKGFKKTEMSHSDFDFSLDPELYGLRRSGRAAAATYKVLLVYLW